MPSEQILALLIAERDKLTRAIEALQGSAKRRGRPPKNHWKSTLGGTAASEPNPEQKRNRRTAAQRKAQAEKMRQYWAERRKAEGKRAKKAD
jgi:hypothetical protein